MSEFIDVKSPKAKGKRFSTLEIAKIEDITPAPVVEESIDDETADDAAMAESEVETGSASVDVPFTITNEVPEDSKPIDEQLSLF